MGYWKRLRLSKIVATFTDRLIILVHEGKLIKESEGTPIRSQERGLQRWENTLRPFIWPTDTVDLPLVPGSDPMLVEVIMGTDTIYLTVRPDGLPLSLSRTLAKCCHRN